jgi:hypothetical protein
MIGSQLPKKKFFAINCNPKSEHYGKILAFRPEGGHHPCYMYIHYNDIDELIGDLAKWIISTPKQVNYPYSYGGLSANVIFQLDLRVNETGEGKFLNPCLKSFEKYDGWYDKKHALTIFDKDFKYGIYDFYYCSCGECVHGYDTCDNSNGF